MTLRMKAVLVVFLFLAGVGVCPGSTGATAKAAEAPWPPWDGKETVAEYAKRAGLEPMLTLKLSGKVSLEFVLIAAGKFLMGSPEMEKQAPHPHPTQQPAQRNQISYHRKPLLNLRSKGETCRPCIGCRDWLSGSGCVARGRAAEGPTAGLNGYVADKQRSFYA